MFAQQTTALLLGPVGGVEERRGLGPRAQARFVNRLRAACLSAVNEVNAASSARAPNTEHRRAVRPQPDRLRRGRLFFGDFLLAKQKKVTAPPGAHPGNGLTQ